MAKGLQAKPAPSNVTKLPDRAARGAGKSKPTEPKVKLKPAVPPGRPEPSKEEKLRDALKLQIVGYTAQHRQVDEQLAVYKEEMKAIQARRKQIRTAIQTAGMPLALFDESYEDAGTSRVDLERKEKLRRIVREAHGLMVEAQGELLENLPEAAKPSVYWEAQGYQDGIGGKFAKAPDECPPENRQDYLRGHANAMEINAKGIKAVKVAEDKAPPPPAAPDGDATDDDSDRDDDETTDVEKAIGGGSESVDRDPPSDPPSAPELDGAPQTEPGAEPVLH